MRALSDTALRRLALATFGAVVVAVVTYVECARAVEGHPGLTYPDARYELGEVLGSLAVAVTGLVLTWLRPRNPMGWLVNLTVLCLMGSSAGQFLGARLALLDPTWSAGTWLVAASAPLWIPAIAVPPTVLLVRYPSGAIEGRWARRFDRLVWVGMPLLLLGYALSPEAVTDMLDVEPGPDLSVVAGPCVVVGGVLLICGLLAILGDAVGRLLRSRGDERRALALLFATVVTTVAMAFVAPWEWTLSLAWSTIFVAIAVGVLKYGALGIELTVLTGDRGDPFAALNKLGLPMGQAVDERTLPDVLLRLQQALGAEGVAVEGVVSSAVGDLTTPTLRVPLTFGGEDLGALVVSSRHTVTTSADRRLAEAVAPLLAAVLHAVRLAEELREERQHVLTATEAERRRLRQELHDGLGPSLTGIGLGLEALASTVPERSDEMVRRLRAEVASSLEETRRIIDDLRPSALDDGDLVAALRRRADQVSDAARLTVSVSLDSAEAADHLRALPPVVATTALRIAEEALTNVVRHAGARRCELRLGVHAVPAAGTPVLRLQVLDDGIGYAGPREGGVGISSMRERAERVGGTFDLARSPHGTLLTADLPLEAP